MKSVVNELTAALRIAPREVTASLWHEVDKEMLLSVPDLPPPIESADPH